MTITEVWCNMKLRKLKKILKNRSDFDEYNFYKQARLYNRSYRECITPLRIIDDYFYVTTQHSIGYVNRDDFSLDRARTYLSNKTDVSLLYAEYLISPFEDTELHEIYIGHFTNLKSAINWVGRYGGPYGDKVQYYYISKRFVYRIWNSTHLTGAACKLLFQ